MAGVTEPSGSNTQTAAMVTLGLTGLRLLSDMVTVDVAAFSDTASMYTPLIIIVTIA